MVKSDEHWIAQLQKMIEDQQFDPTLRSRHYACIVYRGVAVAFGQNVKKSHPFQLKFGKNRESIFIHSEVGAIYNALRRISLNDLKRSTLYVTRLKQVSSVDTTLIPGDSRPCEGCARCIATFNIRRVICTGPDGDIMECT
jgi:tRNA(Arg) A34 adenosine deaminase TadA